MARPVASSYAALTSLAIAASVAPIARAADPAETIAQSEQVLAELIAIPGKQIPAKLLSEAQGIAIVPRVIKIGFVAGGRRGHGVVLVRDAEGAWSLPRFVKLTGGSVGWQAGVSGTDVVLVFRTRRSVENLLKGKFTIGVDAAAAAGPVGRNAAAATDASLQAEILSYSRSRGLFLGAAIDGSVIELDAAANTAYYGSVDVEFPQAVPPAATHLQAYVTELAGGMPAVAVAAVTSVAPGAVVAPSAAPPVLASPDPALAPPVTFSPVRTEALRQALSANSAQLSQLLSPEWQVYLAIPAEAMSPDGVPNVAALADALSHYEQVAASPQYAELSGRPEFQATMELLRETIVAANAARGTLQLPAPPPIAADRR
jgi:lipid-binding SYLF domain-containing protein